MNILAIGAHFDDIELGCGGTLAKHVAEGDSVHAYVATLSGYRNVNNQVVRSVKTASREGVDAMRILGVRLMQGSFNALEVEFREELDVEIIKIVEEKEIEQVYTHWVGDIHHDHQAVARAALHSCRHIPRLLMYRSNWYHSNLDFRENFYVDISDYWSIKEDAVKAHESELERTADRWLEFFKNEAANAGQRIGVEYAEVFEVVKWLA